MKNWNQAAVKDLQTYTLPKETLRKASGPAFISIEGRKCLQLDNAEMFLKNWRKFPLA